MTLNLANTYNSPPSFHLQALQNRNLDFAYSFIFIGGLSIIYVLVHVPKVLSSKTGGGPSGLLPGVCFLALSAVPALLLLRSRGGEHAALRCRVIALSHVAVAVLLIMLELGLTVSQATKRVRNQGDGPFTEELQKAQG